MSYWKQQEQNKVMANRSSKDQIFHYWIEYNIQSIVHLKIELSFASLKGPTKNDFKNLLELVLY